jgi:hypothetical protein
MKDRISIEQKVFYFQGQGITTLGLFLPRTIKESSQVFGLSLAALSFDIVAS